MRRMHVVRKSCDQHRVNERRGRRDSQRSTVQKRAAAALGREQLAPRGVVHRGHLGDAVDFERERRAEDRQAVREIRRAVDRIEHPARPGRRSGEAAHLLRQHLMVGKAFGDQIPEHPLHGDVDFRHQIDRALLVDAETAAKPLHLRGAGADDSLDGGGKKQRIPGQLRRWGKNWRGRCPQGPARAWSSGFPSRLRERAAPARGP